MYLFRVIRVQLDDENDAAAMPVDWEPFHAEPATVSGGGWVVYLRQDDQKLGPDPAP
jgi:hypothetical protein